MHKCINNTIGNVYHLEQMVDNFFPYSQKQLGFDQPATIIFQSDEDNAGRMLGKTAYYNPETFEVVLYTDGRHPKDVMRSLSHELVHHAQNCRGDFTAADSTSPGYAQKDLHLRKMEREAYTKGNLIFRDFEDLIKTGKINIEIDFSDSGEPKMSLKEWKNNELNTLLMKKWGLLNEAKKPDADGDKIPDWADKNPNKAGGDEDRKPTNESEDLDEAHCARKEDEDLEEAQSRKDRERESANQRGNRSRSMEDAMDLEEVEKPEERGERIRSTAKQAQDRRKIAQSPADEKAVELLQAVRDYLLQSGTQATGDVGTALKTLGRVMIKKAKPKAIDVSAPLGPKDMSGDSNPQSPNYDSRLGRRGGLEENKITAAEARKITRRIIERVKKESN